jgi:hypothetical protein
VKLCICNQDTLCILCTSQVCALCVSLRARVHVCGIVSYITHKGSRATLCVCVWNRELHLCVIDCARVPLPVSLCLGVCVSVCVRVLVCSPNPFLQYSHPRPAIEPPWQHHHAWPHPVCVCAQAYTDASKLRTSLNAILTHRITLRGVSTFIHIEEQKATATNTIFRGLWCKLICRAFM